VLIAVVTFREAQRCQAGSSHCHSYWGRCCMDRAAAYSNIHTIPDFCNLKSPNFRLMQLKKG